MAINCNEINQIAAELKMKFEAGMALSANDLDLLVELTLSTRDCSGEVVSIDSSHYKQPLETITDLTNLNYLLLTDKQRHYVKSKNIDYFWDSTATSGDQEPFDKDTNTLGYWINSSLETLIISDNNKITGTDIIDISALTTIYKDHLLGAINENKAKTDSNETIVTDEITRASIAEQLNTTAIAEEVTRATAAEEANETAIAGLTTGYLGDIIIADVFTTNGIYTPTEEGTYTNAGGLTFLPSTTDIGFDVKFSLFNSVWTKLRVDLNITFDATPTTGSTNAVESGGIFTALQNVSIVTDPVPTTGSTNAVESGGVADVFTEVRDGYDFSQHTTQNISVVTGVAVNQNNGFIEIDLKLGKTATFTFNDPNTLIGAGTYFLWIRNASNNNWGAPTVISKGIPKDFTATYDVNGYFVGIGSGSVLGTGTIELKYDYDEVIDSLIKQQAKVVTESYSIISDGDAIVDFNDKFGLQDSKRVFNNVPSIVIGGDNTKARYVRNLFNPSAYLPSLTTINDSFLSGLGITQIDTNNISAISSEVMGFSKFLYESDGDLYQKLADGNGKRFRLEVFVYSKYQDFPIVGSTSKVGSSGNYILSNLISVENTTSAEVKKLVFSCPNNFLITATYLQIDINCTATATYNVGDYGLTGWKIGLFENATDETTKELIGDWELEKMATPFVNLDAYSAAYSDLLSEIRSSGVNGFDFNKSEETKRKIALYFNRYENQYLDEWNRVLVSFNGDSIIGSQLDDIEKSAEYLTGDFPPNMSKLIMARQFYDRYKLDGEDTVFRNLIHSDWSKTGFDVSNGKDDANQTFNQIEVYGGADGDSAQITVNGFKYLKIVWSEYKGIDYSFDILRSTDGGTTFTPIETISVTNARRLMVAYKIYEITTGTSYVYKIIPTSGYADTCFWGVEMWNNPRLDVVVEAFSGSTAADNVLNKLDGYYSEFHKPSLIIMDILAINDYAVSNNTANWMENLIAVYDFIKSKGIPTISIGTHYGTEFVRMGVDFTVLQDIPTIDILAKIANPGTTNTSTMVNQVDGLHLNDYGNTYYFEELIKIFG